MTDYLLIGYSIGIVVFLAGFAERTRENKDNADIELMRQHPLGPAVMAATALAMSAVWPWFAFTATLRWLAPWLRATAARLREYAGEDGR